MLHLCWALILLCMTSTSGFANEDPIVWVNNWFAQEQVSNPIAKYKFACLCTVSKDAGGNGRIIDIVQWDQSGALFFTHQNCQKVQELQNYPLASLNFWLPGTKRQMTITGLVRPQSRDFCEPFWHKMPRQMQLTFVSSDHRSPIDSTASLQATLDRISKQYPETIPMPEAFVGYKLVPAEIVFFEIVFGNFPNKYVCKRNENGWSVQQMQP